MDVIVVERLGLPLLLALAGLSACTTPGARTDTPISTDRPGLLFAPTVVASGTFQVEAGVPAYALSEAGDDETRAWSFPVALRLGLNEKAELRASLPTWTAVRVESGGAVARDDGLGDAEVGVKLALPPWASGPLALLVSARLPTGTDGFTADRVGGSAYLLKGHDLGSQFWFQGMLGVAYLPADGGKDATSGALGALVARSLAEGVSAYVNAAALPGFSGTPGQALAGAGFTWAPRPDLQLDLSADFGLDDDSADALVGFGVSWRL